MVSSNASGCAFAEELYDLTPLQIVQWVYILTSIASISFAIYTSRKYLHRTIFENVTKGSQLVYRYLATQKCDAQVPKAWCIFRYILTVITLTFGLIHVGITLQFLLSSLHFGKRALKVTTRLSIAASFVYALALAVLSYHNESVEGRTPYCSGWTAHSEGMLMFNVYFFFVLDIFNALASLFLWKFNQRKFTKERNSFDLSLSFHRRQNLYAMEQFLPIASLHSLFYLVWFFMHIFSKVIKSNMCPGRYLLTSVVAKITPYYCFLCPLLFLILIRRGRFKRISHVHNMINPERNPNDVRLTN